MKLSVKSTLIAGALTLAISGCSEAQSPATPTTGAAAVTISSSTPANIRESYAIGTSFGSQVRGMLAAQKLDYDAPAFVQGLQEGFLDKNQLTNDELDSILKSLQKRLTDKMVAEQKAQEKLIAEATAKALEDGQKFRAEFAKEDGVIKTESGLLYKIEKAGEGDLVKAEDTVLVHYRGTLVDGTEFDSSYKRNEPATIPLELVIPGWKEGLTKLKKGAKAKLVIPADLAYGDQVVGEIPGNSTLIFDVVLMDINPVDEVAKDANNAENQK